MMIKESLQKIKNLLPKHVTLVAVSKTKPISDIQEAYDAGQRIFGENKIQEMASKFEALPKDIEWHMIGHLQRNKVKYMAHFVNLIHGVDSLKTLQEINKQAKKHHRIINCLLQIKIAKEDSKFGLSFDQAKEIIASEEFKSLQNIKITGLMGMATFTDNEQQLSEEFSSLHTFFLQERINKPELTTLSMGMSGDYELAIKNGSNMVRIGSSIFGHRNYIA
nr:YggS family pyridoxal phosphate-dependent enzyme [Tenacibaculum sp. MAR_2010_89]